MVKKVLTERISRYRRGMLAFGDGFNCGSVTEPVLAARLSCRGQTNGRRL